MRIVTKTPNHTRRLTRVAVDDHLKRSSRAILTGQIDALFERDLILVGVEGPDVFVGNNEAYGMSVRGPGGGNFGVKVKPDGEFVAESGRQEVALAREKKILSIEPMAIGGKRDAALMHEPKSLQVAVVRGAQ